MHRFGYKQLVTVALWAGYCIAVSTIGPSGHFEPTSFFLLFVPAQLILGYLVPRWSMTLAPIVLTVLLGWLTYSVACPCHENGVGFFYALWTFYFAIPGVLLVALGTVARKATLTEA
jgi:hypothetical protein